MADELYEAAVKETFETKPLRTVLMIDDEFPSFADLARGEGERQFPQKDLALALYEGFRARHMVCDVDNRVDDIHVERFRKSDLIILDYNLDSGETNNEKAIAILRKLAASKHFTTVVVYTASPNLDEVWLEIIASLAAGWKDLPSNLTGDSKTHWERLSDEERLPLATHQAVMQFAKRGRLRDLEPKVREASQAELITTGVPAAACGPIIEAMIHRELARRAGKFAEAPRSTAVGGFDEGNRWIQSRNSFVAILKKDGATETGSETTPIMECLSKALLSWRPNLFQILISEIQNLLELEALATEDIHLSEPSTQTALWYYLLELLGPLELSADPDVKAPLAGVVDKIVDSIRRRLSSDSELIQLARNALIGELRDRGWTKESWPQRGSSEMFNAAKELAKTKGLVECREVMFRLNSFFSTERFRRSHLTTGTVFRHASSDIYWIAASPACDLVARRPSELQSWTHSIHPLTALVAIRLTSDQNVDGALIEATQGRHIFLETSFGQKVFKIVNGVGQPIYEFIMVENEGRVKDEGGKTIFEGMRLASETDQPTAEWTLHTFEIVDQLRGLNATQILQMAGHHLSRVGLDFVDMPRK
jgi:hypothetical protein